MLEKFRTGDWYYYRTLPPQDQEMYMQIFQCIQNDHQSVRFPVPRINGKLPSTEHMLYLMLRVVWDNPQIYFFDATNAVLHYNERSIPAMCTLEYTDYFTLYQDQQIYQTLLMRADLILQDAACCRTDYQKVRYIHDYLVRNVRYMFSISKTNTLENMSARTVVGPILNNIAVCAGYAKAFKLLCDQLGLCCFYIRGQGFTGETWGNHGWNVVMLDGQFYHVDVTWDSLDYQRTGRLSYRYFLRCDAVMDDDHRWDRSMFPASTNDHPMIR